MSKLSVAQQIPAPAQEVWQRTGAFAPRAADGGAVVRDSCGTRFEHPKKRFGG